MKIVIHADADFTPKGKRRVAVVHNLRGQFGPVTRIRWYVSGRIYRSLSPTTQNIEMSNDWASA